MPLPGPVADQAFGLSTRTSRRSFMGSHLREHLIKEPDLRWRDRVGVAVEGDTLALKEYHISRSLLALGAGVAPFLNGKEATVMKTSFDPTTSSWSRPAKSSAHSLEHLVPTTLIDYEEERADRHLGSWLSTILY